MASRAPSSPDLIGSRRVRWVLWAAIALLGIGAGVGLAFVRTSERGTSNLISGPASAWGPHQRPAPAFGLRDQSGRALTTASLRGRVTIVSFIDPVCRNLCPLEAKELTQVVTDLGSAAPAVVAVSVNPPADTANAFRQDARVWKLPPSWRWGLGPAPTLARVWRDYAIGVQVQRKTIAGVTVRNVVHTEAAYVLDARGDERALFVWPYRAADVEKVVRAVS